jgi:hypothetical protein
MEPNKGYPNQTLSRRLVSNGEPHLGTTVFFKPSSLGRASQHGPARGQILVSEVVKQLNCDRLRNLKNLLMDLMLRVLAPHLWLAI